MGRTSAMGKFLLHVAFWNPEGFLLVEGEVWGSLKRDGRQVWAKQISRIGGFGESNFKEWIGRTRLIIGAFFDWCESPIRDSSGLCRNTDAESMGVPTGGNLAIWVCY